ncbi:MAG: hypothetical protein K0R98_410 [Rickettsiaceae bacterium]|jgi:hypothetical protein|nr:hypothetical protein [Rickettsiaceae bacterium]
MRNIIALIITCFGLIGCASGNSAFDLFATPITLNTAPPEGPEEYQKGWHDGCESGITATNTSPLMMLGTYKYTLDEELRYNNLYNAAWKYGYNHCGYSMKSLAQYSL